MNGKKIVVPEGMLRAAADGDPLDAEELRAPIEKALRWLRENPIVPRDGEAQKIWNETGICNEIDDAELRCIVCEWQRRMFLVPEPEVPEEIEKLLLDEDAPQESRPTRAFFNNAVIEAFRLGQKEGQR